MLVIRRLYTYAICGISLLLLAIGVTNLLEFAFAGTVDLVAGTHLLDESGEALRQDISLYLALVAVAAPIWALHWYLANRWSAGIDSVSDSSSSIRAGYFAVVLTVAIVILSVTILDAIESWLSHLLDVGMPPGGRETMRGIAIAAISLAVWSFHTLVTHRGFRAMPPSGAVVWPLRMYHYGATLVSGFMFLTGLVLIFQLALDAVVERQVFSPDRFWWASTVATSVSLIIVGGTVWSGHWWYSRRLVARGGPWTIAETGSRFRGIYHYTFVLAGAVALLIGSGIAGTELLRALLDVDPGPVSEPLWARVVEPVLVAMPFLGAWWIHLRWIRDDRRRLWNEAEEAKIERLSGYIASLAGLSFAAVCLGYLLGLVFEAGMHGIGLIDERQASSAEEVSAFLAFAVVGTLLWGWYWRGIRERSASQREAERRSTSRRAYLYLVLTGATLALLSSLAFALYQLLQLLLGVGTSETLMSDLGVVLGVVVVASALAAYHLVLLREDMGPAQETTTILVPEDGPDAPEPASLTLTLSGAAESTLREVMGDLQRHLPSGVSLSESVARVESHSPDATVGLQTDDPHKSAENGDYGPPVRILH